jgi:hypothetical protein
MEEFKPSFLLAFSSSSSSSDEIIPTSTTLQPDFNYFFSGSLELSGSAESIVIISKSLNSSWSINGVFESGFISEWGVGEGEYYWYRIEGSCGESRCDTTGVVYETCERMTLVTIVGARNTLELCENLANPVINPRIDFKISSIKKYSRPIERIQSDECNVLIEQEFCNIPECLDYCIDQDVKQNVSFSMQVIESLFFFEMKGGVSLSGRVQTDRNRSYNPEFPIIGFTGFSQSIVSVTPSVTFGKILISGQSLNSSTYFLFEDSSSIGTLSGFASTSSPNRSYTNAIYLNLSGSSFLIYSPNPSGSVELQGQVEASPLIPFYPSGKIEISGRVVDYISPFFTHNSSGFATISGASTYNFKDYGLFKENAKILMSVFDFGSEISASINSNSRLTISNQSIFPLCGCGPMSLVLSLRHNMLNSSYLSSFLTRSGLTMGDSVSLRYRSSDSSWRATQNFVGKGNDGVSPEEMSFFYSISCLEDFWVFSFSAISANRFTSRELYTKLAADIPADLICSDGNISTLMELEIKSGDFSPSLGRRISAVTPERPSTRNPDPRGSIFYVDGIFNNKKVYYDDIGLFKNNYWINNRLEMSINIPSGAKMPELEMFRIFP